MILENSFIGFAELSHVLTPRKGIFPSQNPSEPKSRTIYDKGGDIYIPLSCTIKSYFYAVFFSIDSETILLGLAQLSPNLLFNFFPQSLLNNKCSLLEIMFIYS